MLLYVICITPPFSFKVSTMELPPPIATIHFRIVRCGSTGFSAAPEYYKTAIPAITNLYGVLLLLLLAHSFCSHVKE